MTDGLGHLTDIYVYTFITFIQNRDIQFALNRTAKEKKKTK